MTVIAYRDGIMAADTAMWDGGDGERLAVSNITKIKRLPDGGLIACTGRTPDIAKVHEWLRKDGPKPAPFDKDCFGAMLVRPDGSVWNMSSDLDIYPAGEAPCYAEGGHRHFMMGAMMAGASAREAVEMAMKFGDCGAGMVQVEML